MKRATQKGAERRALWFCLLLVACPAAKPQPQPPAQTVGPGAFTIFVTTSLSGYVGPCGCSENMRGGIARAAHQIDEARKSKEPVFFIDTGDTLFGTDKLPDDAVPQQELKAKTLASVLKEQMKLDLTVPGPLDDARGLEFRKALALPEMPPASVKLFDARGVKWALVEGDATTVVPRALAARQQGAAFVLAMVRAPIEAVARLTLPEPSPIDFFVAAVAREDNKLVRTGVPIAQVQSKGRSLLRLEVTVATAGRFELLRGAAEQERELGAVDQRIELLRTQVNEPGLKDELKALRKGKLEELVERRAKLAATPVPAPTGKNAINARFVPLESNSPQLQSAETAVTAYDRAVGTLNLEWAKTHGHDCPAPEAGQAGYSGNASCESCHEETFPVWKASLHATALPTLEKVGKQHHLDCIGCHVTGWQRTGGVCRLDKTQGFENVGCESCHGPGSVHVADPSNDNIAKGNTPATCTGCHDPENSPHFEFEKYLTQVLGPGHGQPLPAGAKADAGVADAGTPAKPAAATPAKKKTKTK